MNCNKVLSDRNRQFLLKKMKDRGSTGKYHRKKEREVSYSLSEEQTAAVGG